MVKESSYWMHDFKCHSRRTCNTWAKGSIVDDKISYEWSDRSSLEEDAPTNSVSAGGVDMASNVSYPNVMKKHIRRNKKDQDDLTKKIGKMPKKMMTIIITF